MTARLRGDAITRAGGELRDDIVLLALRRRLAPRRRVSIRRRIRVPVRPLSIATSSQSWLAM